MTSHCSTIRSRFSIAQGKESILSIAGKERYAFEKDLLYINLKLC